MQSVTDSGKCPHCKAQLTRPARGAGEQGLHLVDRHAVRVLLFDPKTKEQRGKCSRCSEFVRLC